MPRNKFYWGLLPGEIRNEIVGLLPAVGAKCSIVATVCQEWTSILEPLNFSEISLTVPRLIDPGSLSILSRKRRQIRYIWFRMELKQYNCSKCGNRDPDRWGLDNIDNQLIVDAFERLFATLSTWEPRPRGDLILDISVYSPSDNQHWFKYLSVCSDTHHGECLSPHRKERGTTLTHDPTHGWVAGKRVSAPGEFAVEKIFEEIMGEGPFDDEEPEMEWWRSLSLVPAVGVVLFRQQTRRRWKPVALSNMLTRFPNMRELCYEPWREWTEIEPQTDERLQTLIESLPRTGLRKLTIFENFNESYPKLYSVCPAIRVPEPAVSRKLAHASLHLTSLSASFNIDAGLFFAARQNSWTWVNLTSLSLTSTAFTDDPDTEGINDMLRDAASAALKMPKLGAMELWNGRRGVAMLFRFQMARDGQSAIITVRGTMELGLEEKTTQAWNLVARLRRCNKVTTKTSLIDADLIRSHGDAIHHLGLLIEVVRPVSLRQILDEHEFRN